MSQAQLLVVDRAACAGHGLCYGTAPDLIDCNDQGDPIVPDRPLGADEVELAREAILVCPERALTLATAPAAAAS
ncbi:ferredoxin [Gordonia sp. TBRC 11910]|uniref:Ferredoxin n=2 Tax=Gordonia asplenii TaxID=2725283 RepID=A0A848KZP8_9ACTN|nr:ferredoxin [Gordonia asplenii]